MSPLAATVNDTELPALVVMLAGAIPVIEGGVTVEPAEVTETLSMEIFGREPDEPPAPLYS